MKKHINPTILYTYSNTPTLLKKRILIVDALRGFALFGILLIHIGKWFIIGFEIPAIILQKYQQDSVSIVLNYFCDIFISGKFYTIFSFLFGVSFAIQLLQRKTDARFVPRFMWRLIILFTIGFIHYLHWKGDILMFYAFLGFFMLLFRNASDRILLIAILFFTLNIPTILRLQRDKIFPITKTPAVKLPNVGDEKLRTEKNYTILKTGKYAEIINQNFKNKRLTVYFQYYSGRIFITFGFFLLGLWVGRRKIFENFEENKHLIKKAMWWSIGANILSIPLYLVYYKIIFWDNMPDWFTNINNIILSFVYLPLTIFYISGISLLLNRKSYTKLLEIFSVVGKMALTNYLMQTAIGILLFYGIGLGLALEISPAWCYLLGIVVFIFQIIFSKWWLSKFKFGPMEWFWRSATHLKWQPMRNKW